MTVKELKDIVNRIPEDQDGNTLMNECLNGVDVERMYPVKRVLFEKLMTFTYIRVV